MPQRISHFSPNTTPPEVLKAIFVQQQHLLDNALKCCRESILTPKKHHLLFVGPRGSGKTHLVALIDYHLHEEKLDCEKGLVAWLNEDRLRSNYLHLLSQIYEALSKRYPEQFPKQEFVELNKWSGSLREQMCEQLLLQKIGAHTVVVLIENLDSLFHDMHVKEQRKWRALLQNTQQFATVATAQSLNDGMTSRDNPFFGFFDIIHLKPLRSDEALKLLQNIATHNDDVKLLAYLGSGQGQARVMALHHLTNGSPRLFVLIAGILTEQCERDSSAIHVFEELIDQVLTPYYQERLRYLAPQQRELVEILCDQTTPVSVTVMAKTCNIPVTTATSQLMKLKEWKYVTNKRRGRQSLYELYEPLMRVSLQVKDARGAQPIGMIVEFLQIWYEQEELEKIVGKFNGDEDTSVKLAYAKALEMARSTPIPLVEKILRDGIDGFNPSDCTAEELKKLENLCQVTKNWLDLFKLAQACNTHGRYDDALKVCNDILEKKDLTNDEIALTKLTSVISLWQLGRFEEVLEINSSIISLNNIDPFTNALTLSCCGNICKKLSRYEEANKCFSQAIEMPGVTPDNVTKILNDRGLCYQELGQHDKAISDFTKVIETKKKVTPERKITALINRGKSYYETNRMDEAFVDFTKVLEFKDTPSDNIAQTLVRRAVIYQQTGKSQEAITDCSRGIGLSGVKPETMFWLYTNRADYHSKQNPEKALEDYNSAVAIQNIDPESQALALHSRGELYSKTDRMEEAISDFTRVIEMHDCISDAWLLFAALFYRGTCFSKTNRVKEAMADYILSIKSDGATETRAGIALTNCGKLGTNGFNDDYFDDSAEQGQWISALREETNAEVASNALTCLRIALFAKENEPWEKTMQRLSEASLKENAADLPGTALMAGALVSSIMDHEFSAWISEARDLVMFFKERNALAALGNGLVRKLKKLESKMLNEQGLSRWLEAWQEASANEPAMALPLRLLATGVHWIQTHDESVLSSLTRDEIPLLRTALGIKEEKKEGMDWDSFFPDEDETSEDTPASGSSEE